MREDVQHGFERPIGLIIVEKVLGKTAGVHNAEVRVDGGPAVGSRLATIIKARPAEPARCPRPGRIIRPPCFRRLIAARLPDVVSQAITVDEVNGVNATRANRAGCFRTDDGFGRVTGVESILLSS